MDRTHRFPFGTALSRTSFLGLAALLLFAAFQMAGPAWAQTAAFCPQTNNETVQTDLPSYQPEESVVITGSGYQPDCSVYVRVTRPDGKVYSGDGSFTEDMDIVTTDAAGGFTYIYSRSGNSIFGRHIINVLGGDLDVFAPAIFHGR